MKVTISPYVIFMGLIFFISKKLDMLIVPLIAATVHEFGHLCMALLLNIPIQKIEINLFGALIHTKNLNCSYKNEALLAAAGPAANILSASITMMLFRFSPFFQSDKIFYFIVSSVAFAIINLLPAENFDGGRILSCMMLCRFDPKMVKIVLECMSFFCFFLLWSISVYFIIRTGAYLSLFVFSGALFSKMFLSQE